MTNKNYIEDKIFERINFTEKPFPKGDYENCRFINCDFSNAEIRSVHFYKCMFEQCNLSMVDVAGTALKDVTFKGCKLVGVHFENCTDFMFMVGFQDCTLNLSSFYERQLKNTQFRQCIMHETDFTEADLTNAKFDNCDLMGAVFQTAILEKADLRTAYNFSIDPELNKMKKAKFALGGLAGLLGKYKLDIEP